MYSRSKFSKWALCANLWSRPGIHLKSPVERPIFCFSGADPPKKNGPLEHQDKVVSSKPSFVRAYLALFKGRSSGYHGGESGRVQVCLTWS